MRIGLCTIHDPSNYGNRLQCFAACTVLSQHGHEVVELVSSSRPAVSQLKESSFVTHLRRMNPLATPAQRRYAKAIAFSGRNWTTEYVDENSLSELAVRFDMFVVGSDQVWNPRLPFGARMDGFQCLAFTDPKQRIALAPSFGLDRLPDEWCERYGAWISGFSALSVRERSGQQIIRELTGRDSAVLVDPTLALADESWREVARRPGWATNAYVLVYSLGGLSAAQSDLAERIARRERVRIVRLFDRDDRDASSVGPEEFVSLIDGARYVLTDSFHACVFSTILHTPFVVWPRTDKVGQEMWSRINDFTRTFLLTSRVLDGGFREEDQIDWTVSDAVLTDERSAFNEYVQRATSGAGGGDP